MAEYPALDLRFAPLFDRAQGGPEPGRGTGPGAGTLQDFLYAELDAFEPIAIHEHESGAGWRVFFRSPTDRDSARAALRSEFGDALLELSPVEVDDEDWARRSQANLKAVRAGRIVVAPPWDVPGPESDVGGPGAELVVVIEPSMGFGTGHHATTRLCLQLLQQIDVNGKTVVDVGTGSGVLAIAAAKLRATRVLAVDNDPDALQNARENIVRNSVEDVVELRESDVASLEAASADIILANLTGAVLQREAANLMRLVGAEGRLIVSGFGPDEMTDVVSALGAAMVSDARDGEWAAGLLSR